MYDGRDWSDDEWRGWMTENGRRSSGLRIDIPFDGWRLTTFDRWLLWRNGIQPEWPDGKVVWIEISDRGGVS